jgi:hypothetical protein
MSKNIAQNEPHAEPETEPTPVTTSPVPVVSGKQGCSTSFLTQKKNEMDTTCGAPKPRAKEQYVQPEAEKESGGEA